MKSSSNSVVLVTALYLENIEAELAQKGLEGEQELIKKFFLMFITTQQAVQMAARSQRKALLAVIPIAVRYLGFADIEAMSLIITRLAMSQQKY